MKNFLLNKIKEFLAIKNRIYHKKTFWVLFIALLPIQLNIHIIYYSWYFLIVIICLIKNILKIFIFKYKGEGEIKLGFDSINYDFISYLFFFLFQLPDRISLLLIYNFLTRNKTHFNVKEFLFRYLWKSITGISFSLWMNNTRITACLLIPFQQTNWKKKKKKKWIPIYLEILVSTYPVEMLFPYLPLIQFTSNHKIRITNHHLWTNNELKVFLAIFFYKYYMSTKIYPLEYLVEKTGNIAHSVITLDNPPASKPDIKTLASTLTSQKAVKIAKDLSLPTEKIGQNSSGKDQFKLNSAYKMDDLQIKNLGSKIAKNKIPLTDIQTRFNFFFSHIMKLQLGIQALDKDSIFLLQTSKYKQLNTYFQLKPSLSSNTQKFVEEEASEWLEIFKKASIVDAINNNYNAEDIEKYQEKALNTFKSLDRKTCQELIITGALLNGATPEYLDILYDEFKNS